LAALIARNVDGVIISPVDAVKSRAAVAAASKRVPLVQVDRHINVESDVVSVDHSHGIHLVLDHLVAQGCSSFAFVTTTRRVNVASERLEAYIKCVRPIDRASADLVFPGDLSIAWGAEAATRIADRSHPQAIVCANDLIALGVLRTLRRRGIRVPEDVAVTGYDDLVFADMVEPRLTTVRQPLGPLGREAARLVISAIESPGRPRHELRLLPELVVRESSTLRSTSTACDGQVLTLAATST
jgi:LacI family transcriptional regulator